MDIETFLQMRPTWAYQPCLYIVKQMFPGNNAYRCGAAGTQLFKQADPVYGADRTGSLTGLLGRMTMYKNYWLPLKGRLYAALRIKKQLIAPISGAVGMGTADLLSSASRSALFRMGSRFGTQIAAKDIVSCHGPKAG